MPTAVITESKREDGVEHHDLRHDGPEFRPFALGGVIAVFPLQPLIKLDGRFKQQKQAAKQHNQIAGAKAEVVKNNQRFGQGDQPEIEASSRRRMTIASIRPVIRARSRWAGGSFSARIAIKTGYRYPTPVR